MRRRRTRLDRFWWTLAVAILVVSPADAQRPVVRPELLAGPWETTTPSGTYGIFVKIDTYAQGSQERQIITRQSIQFRVYRRQDGQETSFLWGWYDESGSASPVFDGQRLRTGPDGRVQLDVRFQPEMHRWSGTWWLDGETRNVVLEPPNPAAGSQVSALRGDWESVPDQPQPGIAFTTIHIAQSSDGALTAWMDQTQAGADQRHLGRLLRIISADPSNVLMEEETGVCCPGRFAGVVSGDGSSLSGNWTSLNNVQGTRQSFRRQQ
jgi:hypothetical protein